MPCEDQSEILGELQEEVWHLQEAHGFGYDDGATDKNGELIPGYTVSSFTLTAPNGEECTFELSREDLEAAIAWIKERIG